MNKTFPTVSSPTILVADSPPHKRYRTALFVVLIALSTLAVVVALAGEGSTQSHVAAGHLESDARGAISDWLLCIPRRDSALFEDTQAELVARADPATQFHVFLPEGDDGTSFRRALLRRGVTDAARVSLHNGGADVWPWARDLFVAGRSEDGGPIAFISTERHRRLENAFDRNMDVGRVANALHGASSSVVDVFVDGGGVVVDEDLIFINQAIEDRALRTGFAGDVASLKKKLRAIWGRPVETLPTRGINKTQHCDLLIMPVGGRRVVLGSPLLAAELIRLAPASERKHFQEQALALLARGSSLHPGHRAEAGRLVEMLLAGSCTPEILRGFKRVRARLEKLGYTCHEVPYLGVEPPRQALLCMLSYTNVVMEERDRKRIVYLPTYRLPMLDAAAAAMWRKLGFKVVRVDSLGPALLGGAVRCMSQVYRD